MKKLLLFTGIFLFVCAAGLQAQNPIPKCQNQAAFEGKIDAIENQGWVETSRNFAPILYLVPPTPPYLAGTATVGLAPDCAPGDPCPEIARIFIQDVWVMNNNGTCVFRNP